MTLGLNVSIPVGLGDVLVADRTMLRLRSITLALVLLRLHMSGVSVAGFDVLVTVLAELFRVHFPLYYDHEIILILFHDYHFHPVSRALHPCCASALGRGA